MYETIKHIKASYIFYNNTRGSNYFFQLEVSLTLTVSSYMSLFKQRFDLPTFPPCVLNCVGYMFIILQDVFRVFHLDDLAVYIVRIHGFFF